MINSLLKRNYIGQYIRQTIRGCIVSIKVEDCNETQAIVKYLPTKNNQYHSEIHGGEDKLLLDKRQRVYLAQKAQKEYIVVE